MKRRKLGFSTSLLAAAMLTAGLMAGANAEDEIEEIIVVGDLGSLPGENVQTVFGFNKSILETSRSVSTISEEMMERFNMHDIDERSTPTFSSRRRVRPPVAPPRRWTRGNTC